MAAKTHAMGIHSLLKQQIMKHITLLDMNVAQTSTWTEGTYLVHIWALTLPSLCCKVHCRLVLVLHRVHVGASLEQKVDSILAPTRSC